MLAKTGLAVSIAICLTAAGAALASERDGSSGYQARQGIGAPSHASFTTDVSHAYALDESSKAKKKKAPQQLKPEPASTSGASSRAESDEAAKERRYEQNH